MMSLGQSASVLQKGQSDTSSRVEAQILLRMWAQHFGYDMNDTAAFNTKFRNPVLSTVSAERLPDYLRRQGHRWRCRRTRRAQTNRDDLRYAARAPEQCMLNPIIAVFVLHLLAPCTDDR